MIVSQAGIRGRIEQLKLSDTGYRRQLAILDNSPERRERLEVDVRLGAEEIATLEKIAQLVRVEPDSEKVEAAVRERLDAVRARMSADPELSQLAEEDRDQSSGEVRALLWVLGEDPLTENMRKIMEGHNRSDPTRTDRAVFAILIHTLEEGPEVEARASAAYELGKLKITQAIPAMVRALEDDPMVSEMALHSLATFSDNELAEAGLTDDIVARARDARRAS